MMMAYDHFRREKQGCNRQRKYTLKRQAHKPYKAVETRIVAVPRCTVVSGQIDLNTGGAKVDFFQGPSDLDEKANPHE